MNIRDEHDKAKVMKAATFGMRWGVGGAEAAKRIRLLEPIGMQVDYNALEQRVLAQTRHFNRDLPRRYTLDLKTGRLMPLPPARHYFVDGPRPSVPCTGIGCVHCAMNEAR